MLQYFACSHSVRKDTFLDKITKEKLIQQTYVLSDMLKCQSWGNEGMLKREKKRTQKNYKRQRSHGSRASFASAYCVLILKSVLSCWQNDNNENNNTLKHRKITTVMS
jgi:hypothetical protein